MPLMLSLGFMTHRFGIYLPSATSAQIIDAVVAQVKLMPRRGSLPRSLDGMSLILRNASHNRSSSRCPTGTAPTALTI